MGYWDDTQQRWMADRGQVKVWEKGRRIGASWTEAADDTLHAAARDGGDVYFISYNRDMTQSFIQDVGEWAGRYGHALTDLGETVLRDGERDVHVFDVAFDSGHHVRAFSSNPRNLRSKGRPGDRVVVDEAAFVDDLSEVLKAAMAVTMWGGEVRIMSTHNGDDNPFADLVAEIRGGRRPYSLHRTTLDDALTDGLFRRICQVTARPWSAAAEADWRAELIERYRPNEDEELFCVPTAGGGAYLPRALVEACMPAARDSGPLLRYRGVALEDRTLALVRHDDVLEDHRAIRLVRGVPRLPQGKTDDAGTRHGDSAIAGMLAHRAASADPPDLGTVATAGPREIILRGADDAAPETRLTQTGWGGVSAGRVEW